MLKAFNDIPENTLRQSFTMGNNINLRSKLKVILPIIKPVTKSRISLKCYKSVIWNSLLFQKRNYSSLESFKLNIKCQLKIYPCRMCKYLSF